MFLLDGDQFILDLIASMIDHTVAHLMTLTELELMEYLRKQIIVDCFTVRTLEELM